MSIPRAFLDELRERTNLADLLAPHLELRQQGGGRYVALCPFHQEKTPSFSIDPRKGVYHCFGCGVSGDAIHFLMERQRLSFREAIEQLAQSAGMEMPKEKGSDKQHKQREQLRELLEEASREYQQALKQSSSAQSYLKQRGLSADTCERFALGYAPADNLITTRLGNSPRRKESLLQAGLLRRNEKGLYDFFRRRIMFPIRDRRGRTLSFGGRVLNRDNPKYLNGPESPLFPKRRSWYGWYESRSEGAKNAPVLIVEGYLDVISLFQHGFRPVVSCMGTAVTAPQLQALFQHNSELLFCFDGDRAGRAAAQRALQIVLPLMRDEKRRVRFMLLPEGKDPDQLVRADAKTFRTRIKETPELSHFLLQSSVAETGMDIQSAEGKAALAARLAQQLKQIPSDLLRRAITEELEARTGIATSQLLGRPSSSGSRSSTTSPSPEPPPNPADSSTASRPPWQPGAGRRRRSGGPRDTRRPEHMIISILLRSPQLAQNMPDLPPEHPNNSEDLLLLREVVRELSSPKAAQQQNPLAYLYGRWQGTSRGSQIEHLPELPKLPAETLPQELHDNLQKLWERHQRAFLEHGELSPQEQQRKRWEMVWKKKGKDSG